MSETTPTPWTLRELRTSSGLAYRIGSDEMLEPGQGCCIIYDDYPATISKRRANAELIVTAVNAHEAMKTALKRAKHELDMAADQLHTLCHVGHAEDIRITIGVLNETLALAEPKQTEQSS